MAYRENRQPINWSIVAAEIADIPGGVAVLRILQGNGVDRLSQLPGPGEELGAFNSIAHMIAMVHEAKR